jgi:serine/threonine protein kinase
VQDDDVNAPTLRASAAGREGAEIPPGAVVCGRYEVRGVIGEGGMGRVLAAWDRIVEREVALKQVRPSGTPASQGELQRLRDELVAIQDVVHPGIVRTYTLEEEGGERFLVMERLRGRSLADARRDGPMPVAEALRIARAVLEALAAVHARGLAHRDVKPGNIFLCDDGRVVLLDFGLARPGLAPSGELGDGVTIDGSQISGTPGYMAPEVMRGERASGPADVYAVGVVLYELVTGVHPFPGRGLALLGAHLDQPAPALDRGPRWLRAAVKRMLAKSPTARPPATTALAPPSRRAWFAVPVALAVIALALDLWWPRANALLVPPEEKPFVDEAAADEAGRAFELGQTAYTAGNYPEAIAQFERAYAFAPFRQMLWNLANAHAQHGDRERARVLFERYRDASPMADWPDAARALQRLQRE